MSKVRKQKREASQETKILQTLRSTRKARFKMKGKYRRYWIRLKNFICPIRW